MHKRTSVFNQNEEYTCNATQDGYCIGDYQYEYSTNDLNEREILVEIFNGDENADLLLQNVNLVMKEADLYIRATMDKHYRARLLKCLLNDRSDVDHICTWLALLVKVTPKNFQYQVLDRTSRPIWLQFFNAVSKLLASQWIDDTVKESHILPFCDHWLGAFEASSNFADDGLTQLNKFAIAIEAYLATQPMVDFPYKHYTNLLRSKAYTGTGFSEKERREFFRLSIERFLRKRTNQPWSEFADYFQSYEDVSSQFISYYFHSDYITTFLLLIYHVPRMEPTEQSGDMAARKRIIEKALSILDRSKSLPELTLVDDKHIDIESLLKSARDFLTPSTSDEGASKIAYYQNTSWSTRLTFCALGLLTALVLVFYALVAAKAITGHSFLFLQPYFFLLHGVAGLVLPAATLVGAFIAYHAYHEIFSPKQEPFFLTGDLEPVPSQHATTGMVTWFSRCVGGAEYTQDWPNSALSDRIK